MAGKSAGTTREAVGVFHDLRPFQDALDELTSSGFDRAALSLLASEATVEQKLGHAYHRVEEVQGDAAVPRAAYADDHSIAEARTGAIGGLAYIGAVAAAGVVVASGGGLAAAIAGAALAGGGGGLLGSIAARFIGQAHAENLQGQLDKGGLLLWVCTADADEENTDGSIKAYTNWRNRLPIPVEAFENDHRVNSVVATLRAERSVEQAAAV